MAQTITAGLTAILAQELQVGADKPRAEIEIDYVIGSTAGSETLLIAYSATTWKVWREQWAGGSINGTPAGWDAPGFDDSGWETPSGVGTATAPAERITPADAYASVQLDSLWWLARSPVFTLAALPSAAVINTARDDDIEVFINGTSVLSLAYNLSDATDNSISIVPFVVGDNVVSFRVKNGNASNSWATNPTNASIRLFLDVPAAAPVIATETYQVASIDLDRSRKMSAAQLDVLMDNETGTKGWYTGDGQTVVPNNPIRAYAWYGPESDRVCVFTGLLDRLGEHRNPKTIGLKARSRMKWMIEQGFLATAPQGVDETGAVRTEANGVYLGKSPEYIFGDICNRAGWPAADRSVGTSGFTLAEYDLADGSSWVDQIAGSDRLTTATGWDLWEDELGVINFRASPLLASTEPTPSWGFAAGVNVMVLDHETDDEDRITRVEVSGPMTSAVPKWEQVWSTSVLAHPVGVWYDPTDPLYIKVIDRVTKYLYRMKQSDRSLTKLKYLGGYPLGLSGDPTDSTRYYVLHAPWRNTGSTTGNSVKKYNASTHALIATYSLPDGRWTDIKTDGTNIWLTNYDDEKLYKRSMTATAVSSATITYGGAVQANPTGLWLNGTAMGVFFAAYKRFLLVSTSAPTTVTSTQSTEGTRIAGGESDTTTDIDLYACAPAGSFGLTSGMVAKFTLAELVTNDVSALSVDWDLEDALGFQSGIANRTHTNCPNIVGTHKFETRLGTYSMKVVQSLAQAQAVADAQLILRSRLRRQLDLATIGHPGVQINDPVSYTDAVAGMTGTWVIDTYRSRIAATYTQSMSLLPWEAP